MIEETDHVHMSAWETLARSSCDLIPLILSLLRLLTLMRLTIFVAQKFSLVWMGFTIADLTRLRAESIGTEIGLDYEGDYQLSSFIKILRLKRLPQRQQRIMCTYIVDMRDAINEIARVLVPGGREIYVIGEN